MHFSARTSSDSIQSLKQRKTVNNQFDLIVAHNSSPENVHINNSLDFFSKISFHHIIPGKCSDIVLQIVFFFKKISSSPSKSGDQKSLNSEANWLVSETRRGSSSCLSKLLSSEMLFVSGTNGASS